MMHHSALEAHPLAQGCPLGSREERPRRLRRQRGAEGALWCLPQFADLSALSTQAESARSMHGDNPALVTGLSPTVKLAAECVLAVLDQEAMR